MSGARATVFGLDVLSPGPLPFLAAARASRSGRRLRLEFVSLSGGWPAGAELISDERLPGDLVSFQIEHDRRRGYRIWGPGYGTSILSGDGASLLADPGEAGLGAWQRMLVAQVLPFAAVLRGLEVLHASAVGIEGGAHALLGPSGAGKTSLALALCRRGASFLADDVLALEVRPEGLLAHPGSPAAAVALSEAARLRAAAPGRQKAALHADGRERVTAIVPSPTPLPLRSLLLLERRPDGPPQPRFEPLADARVLLGASFNLLLRGPDRLRRLLEICSLAAAGAERLVCGPGPGPDELAAVIEERLRGRS